MISLVVQNDVKPRGLPGQSDEPGRYRQRFEHHHLPDVKSEGNLLGEMHKLSLFTNHVTIPTTIP